MDAPFELNRLYRYPDFRPEWAKYLLGPATKFSLPTEVVVGQPQTVVPQQCGTYETTYYSHDGRIVDGEDNSRLDGDVDNQIWMFEVYANRGEGGRYDYHQIGWSFHQLGWMKLCWNELTAQAGDDPLAAQKAYLMTLAKLAREK